LAYSSGSSRYGFQFINQIEAELPASSSVTIWRQMLSRPACRFSAPYNWCRYPPDRIWAVLIELIASPEGIGFMFFTGRRRKVGAA
jgi:hypothetical protein